MPAKKCCERCERFIEFNCEIQTGVCCKFMNVVERSSCCDHYVLDPKLRRKRGAKNGKTNSAAEGDR